MEKRTLLRASLSLFSVLFIFNQSSWGSEELFYKEVNLIGGYSDRDRWVGRSSTLSNSVGFEDYRKFSNEYGDFLTTDVQVRIAYDSLEGSRRAWGLQVHNAWLLYRLNSWLKLRFGHFDPAYGLEPQLDTHGTILQTLAMKDIGFNRDWGAGIEGALPKLDYKVALQLGSGMSIYSDDGNYLITSRIGTPKTENFQLGLSFLYGKVWESMDMNTIPKPVFMPEAVLKRRVGVDGQYLYGPYLFKGEVSYGRNDKQDVLGYLGEVDYTLPRYQNIELELQFQSWITQLNRSSSDDSTVTLGVSCKMNQSTTVRAAFSHDLNMSGQEEENKFLVQLYYFAL